MGIKRIILGITGSIAAYKSAELVRQLVKRGMEVRVIMSASACEFITPLTLSTLSDAPVITDFFARRDGSWHSHVALGSWCEAMLIAPATASTIGKMANGIADNMLITTYLSCRAPVFIAPAMDTEMYAHPSTRQNIVTLRDRGVQVIESGIGELASHLVGRGRMEEPAGIVSALETYFASESDWSKRVLITAGPTYEKLDPVRFISNYSSGKMGYALAEACASRGASVELISGPVSIKPVHPRITLTLVESAAEMYEAVIWKFALMDIGILCAAVSDYRPATYATEKIRHEENTELQLSLISNRDIARELGKRKRADQRLIGFALETDAGIESARKKLIDKNLDLIVLNSLRDIGAGFRCDTNRVKLIYRNGAMEEYGLKSKSAIATEIVEAIIKMY